MKKSIIISALFALFSLSTFAQSTMTDDQVMQFVVKEHEVGSSQSQIVTKLMQRGVDIQQIRRVRSKYEREMKQDGLGVSKQNAEQSNSRLRKNNGKTKDYINNKTKAPITDKATATTNRVQNLPKWQKEYYLKKPSIPFVNIWSWRKKARPPWRNISGMSALFLRMSESKALQRI